MRLKKIEKTAEFLTQCSGNLKVWIFSSAEKAVIFLPRLATIQLSLWIGACLPSFASLPSQPSATEVPRVPEKVHVRVRIAEEVAIAKIRGFDLQIFQPNNTLPIVAADKASEWEVQCQDGQILLQAVRGRVSPGYHFVGASGSRSSQIPPSKSYRFAESVSFRSPVGFMNYGNNPYREEIKIYAVRNRCEVVNVLALEKYLDGLVNSEFSSKWNEESIEAQVVAARTYAYYQIQEAARKKNTHFDLDATVKDQVYNGSLRESFHSSLAAAKTQGMILTAEGSAQVYPIKAYYHSTCGGQTELPENVWGHASLGFNKKVICPYCMGSPRYRWELDLSAAEISSLIIQKVKTEGMLPEWPKQAARAFHENHLLDVKISQIGPEQRVVVLKTIWADGKDRLELPISAVKFREWMGPGRFRSTLFQLSTPSEKGETSVKTAALEKDRSVHWHFEGRGNGHGVGLCQWGAKTMGEKGFKMAAILKHYYPGAALKKMW